MRHLLLIVTALALAPACTVLQVHVDADEVCVTRRQVEVDGVAGAFGDTSITRDFEITDLSALHALTDLGADVHFVGAELRANSGIADFDFVDSMRVTVSRGDDAARSLTLYECDGDCGDGDALVAPANDGLRATDYVDAETLTIGLDVAGRLPEQAWMLDMDLCVAGRADYAYAP